MKQRVVCLMSVILLLTACGVNMAGVRGSGNVAREERQVHSVRAVTLATLGDLTIELGEAEALTIEAEDNLLPYLETEMPNGMLIIRNRPGANLQPTEPIHYYLTVKNLEKLSITSSGNITAPALQANTFTASVSSSGNLHLAGLDANQIRVRISSSGNVVIDGGQIGAQEITLNSSGQYEAGDVRSETAVADLTSNGDATIWVTDTLDASLSSSGNVNYYGSPAVTQSVSSSGKVVSLGNK